MQLCLTGYLLRATRSPIARRQLRNTQHLWTTVTPASPLLTQVFATHPHFNTPTHRTFTTSAPVMSSESEDFDMSGGDTSDSFTAPTSKGKAGAKAAAVPRKASGSTAAAKKKAAPAKTTKAAKPLAQRKSNEGESDEDDFDPDASESVVLKPSKTSKSKAAAEAVPEEGSSTTKVSKNKSNSDTYQKLTQLEHVLLRPDTYIGSVERQDHELWVFDPSTKQMAFRTISYVPGFYKIFDEILVNAADNKVRDPTMDTIKVTINKEEGSITVWNNGKGIPIEIHSKEGIHIPELIFGNLLTSSNYDDDEAKVTGGRNGYGAKLANIYSTEFIVETAEKTSEKKYKQVFSNNMSKIGKPKITSNKDGKQEFTSISFKPELSRFGMTAIDDDIESLMMKRVYDMAGTVKDIKVFLNGERLKVKSFKQYVDMYVKAINELTGEPTLDEHGDLVAGAPAKQTIIYDTVTDKGRTWEVAFAVSDGKFRQCSFVNHIATIQGGTHVSAISSQVETKVMDLVKKDKKNGAVKNSQIRDQLWIFVNCQIVNPTFDGQTKEKLTLKPSAFGSKYTLSDDVAKKIFKAGVGEKIKDISRAAQEKALKKTDGVKRNRITGIVKLEDANNAGTRKGKDCTLILTEGDSAKALAVSGLSEVGRDNFGVFPLRGKMLNVREATADQIAKNVEITHVKTILGLQHGRIYNSLDSLRYGSLMIMTDQDHDGSHIKGLIINFLDHFFPSLLKQAGFLVEFITPIVKCTKGKQEISFFTIPEYERWKEEHNEGKGWVIKYFKGLGTSTAQDAKKYFRAMDKHLLPFDTMQEGDRELIDLAFNKKKADDRKEWLRGFRPGTFLDHNISKVPISDFINKELILFSMADNIRSIPCMVDGLKPGQRKVMFGCFKRKLKAEIKVAQLGGYVSEHSAYHHGEASLYSTIVGLAQDFCGSNNVNILSPNGQFGTRLMGGKDAASARYIFTSLPTITRRIFHNSDDALLKYLNDDGQDIEPEWYMPTVPLVLINGGEGIGTGWSSSIPNFNPKDIVANLRRRMAGEELVPMIPWFRGFTGTIRQADTHRYLCSGIINQIDDKTWEVTELPVRTWTSSFKEWLEERVQGTEKVPATIKEYKEYHTDTTVHFIIELNAAGQKECKDQKSAESYFKMEHPLNTSNMVLFDAHGKIKKYTSPEEILEDFYLLRLSFYQKRKEFLVEDLKTIFERLSNQARFVQMIIKKELIVSNRKRSELVEELRKRDFRAFPKTAKGQVAADPDDDRAEDEVEFATEGGAGDYDYLLGMAIYTLTKEKVERLLAQRDEKEKELNVLLGRTPQNLWDEDLTEFSAAWEELLVEDQRRLKDVGKKNKNKVLRKPGKSGAAARRVNKGSDMDEDEDDSEDDFKPTTKKKSPAKAKASPKVIKAAPAVVAKKPAAPAKRTSNAMDDDDFEMLAAAAPKEADLPAAKKLKQGKLDFGSKPAAPSKPSKFASAAADSDENSDDYIAASTSKAKKALPAAKARAASVSKGKKAIVVDDSDVEMEEPKKAAPKARAVSAGKGKKKAIISSDEDDFEMASPDEAKKAPAKPATSRRAAATKVKYISSADDDDEEEEDDYSD